MPKVVSEAFCTAEPYSCKASKQQVQGHWHRVPSKKSRLTLGASREITGRAAAADSIRETVQAKTDIPSLTDLLLS